MTPFAELIASTNFSFLRGASHAHEIVGQAAELRLAAIGVADRNRWLASSAPIRRRRSTGISLLVGARLDHHRWL